MAVFLRQCHFQILPFYLKSHLRTEFVHCLASPGKVSALALYSGASMNKEKHSLRNLQHYTLGELVKEIPPYLKRDF